jgi:phosphoribosylanthranilate isomerase
VQRLKVKICGITNLRDALFCEKAGADYLGFIFYNKSRRFVEPNNAIKIIEKLSHITKKVGVFVNEDIARVNEITVRLKLDFVQLHGDETPEYSTAIQTKKIKAFRVAEVFDFGVVDKYKDTLPLFDTFLPQEYGGTGKSFDWTLIPKRFTGKFVLSGGLSAQNIENAVRIVKPLMVDISSSLEKVPGIKDHDKVAQFFDVFSEIKQSLV